MGCGFVDHFDALIGGRVSGEALRRRKDKKKCLAGRRGSCGSLRAKLPRKRSRIRRFVAGTHLTVEWNLSQAFLSKA